MPEFAPPNPNQPIDPNIIVPALPPRPVESTLQSPAFMPRGDGYTEQYNGGVKPVGYKSARDFFAAQQGGLEVPQTTQHEAQTPSRKSRLLGRVAAKIAGFRGTRQQDASAGNQAHEPNKYYDVEKLPGYYKRSLLTPENGNDDTTLGRLVHSFRDELLFAANTSDKLGNAYKVARNIGDKLLLDRGDSKITAILDASRWDARPNAFFINDGVDGEGYIGRHSERLKQMELSDAGIRESTKYLENNMRSASVEILNPSDPELFTVLRVVAHEAGHALLAGISKMIVSVSRDMPQTEVLATRLFLTSHPELAFTGDLQTDIATHEERFAEGYGQMVVDAVAAEIGYDETARKELKKIFDDHTAVSKAPQGTHAYDLIADVGAGKTLVDVGKENGMEMYRGDLGYSTALSPVEVAEQVHILSSMISGKQMDKDTVLMPDEAWHRLVKARQSQTTKDVIARQLAFRRSAVDATSSTVPS